jgi:translation initiation factor IF-2
VVVLGHIDHGKSSLLEAIRDFKITAKEAGGITQHIGAYQVEEKGKKITFIDTPGHEAFSQMRSRGAKVADIAILVIDSSEGVKPQTKEAISHIKKAGIPVILALNKIDKPEANPEGVKRELVKEDFVVESMGGKIPSVEVSAKTKKGISELLDLILLVAEMEGFTASLEEPASGVVIESYLDNLRGATATLLITKGILKKGDIIGTHSAFTKVKTIENFQRKPLEKALPSDPVIIFGFNEVPRVGEEFETFSDLETAQKNVKMERPARDASHSDAGEGQRVLNLILKTDVVGSSEAIEEIFRNLPQEKVVLRVLKSEAGTINESDLKLAVGSKATVLGFRVKIDPIAKRIAERENVRIMLFEIIYDLVEGVRKLMEKIAAPEEVRHDFGKVKVLAKFLAEKNRQIIGGRVIEGEVKKGALIEVFRDEEKIGQGRMINLQRNKKDIDSVGKGEECGILFEGEVKIEEGDVLQIYTEEKIKGKL